MRILSGSGCLAVAALALRTAAGDRVTFSNDGFQGPTEFPHKAIIPVRDARDRTYMFTTDGTVEVEEIQLVRWSVDGAANATVGSWSAKAPPDTRENSFLGEFDDFDSNSDPMWWRRNRRAPREPDPLNSTPLVATVDVMLQGAGGTVRLAEYPEPILNSPLYFKALWNGGSSYSRNFIVVRNPREAGAASSTGFYDTPQPHQPEEVSSAVGSPSPGSGGEANLGTPPDATNSNLGDDTGLGNNHHNNNSNNQDKDHNNNKEDTDGGLSSGAVIGIAVACGVVGLALVIALVWYLLRRRHQKKSMLPVGSYSSGNPADELMAEKEANADVAPHSPYSDDGGAGTGLASEGAAPGVAVATTTTTAAAAAAAAGAIPRPHQHHSLDQPRSYTPYSDRPTTIGPGPGTPSLRAASLAPQTDDAVHAPVVSVPSATPGRATPRALTTPYAHLVEEGMTEEEIRRLEEEERQLDQAIEERQRGAGTDR